MLVCSQPSTRLPGQLDLSHGVVRLDPQFPRIHMHARRVPTRAQPDDGDAGVGTLGPTGGGGEGLGEAGGVRDRCHGLCLVGRSGNGADGNRRRKKHRRREKQGKSTRGGRGGVVVAGVAAAPGYGGGPRRTGQGRHAGRQQSRGSMWALMRAVVDPTGKSRH